MTQNTQSGEKGFPWLGEFESMDELREYFDQEKLVCLICGKLCVQLEAHIRPAHDMTADQYKERYGIPWTYGLAGKAFRVASSRRIKLTRKTGKLPQRPTEAHIAKLVKAAKKRRKNVLSVSAGNRNKLLTEHDQTRIWGIDEFNRYLERLRSGRTPSEISHDADVPTLQWLNRFLRQNPHLRKQFDIAWNKLPYNVQVRARKLGAKFLEDVARLRRRGLPWKEVAAQLEINQSTVQNAWHRLKAQGQLTPHDLRGSSDIYSEREYTLFFQEYMKGRPLREIAADPGRPSVAQYYRFLKQHPMLHAKHKRCTNGQR